MEQTKQNGAKISVIVPVFQVAPYLDRCLASVCGQTETDLEILCVYTRSNDNTLEKLRAWAERDARIQIFYRDDGGLGGARNVGLDHAGGQYIAFADSDDWLESDMLEILYRALLEHAAQIAECGFRNLYADHREEEAGGTFQCTEGTNVEAMQSLIDWGLFKPVVWNKLYARETIGAIRFPENCLNEDEFTTYKIFYSAEKLVYVDAAKYNYDRTRDDCLTAQPFGENQLDICFAMQEMMHFICAHQLEPLRESMANHYAWVLLDRLERARRARLHGPKLRRVLRMLREDAPLFAETACISAEAKEQLARLAKGRGWGIARLKSMFHSLQSDDEIEQGKG